MRLDRLLAIITLLLNRRRMSAPELAARFEVSIRTIYRDIASINLAGIPIITFPGNKGGLGIMDNYQLDRQLFTFQDMVSTLSILKGVNQTFKDKHLAATIEKINSLVPKDQKDKLQLQSEQIAVDVLPWGSTSKHKEKLACIQNALSQNRLLKCTYFNSSSKKSIRTIEPMTIVFKGSTWYLFGYCRLKKAFRVFRVTRMLRLQTLQQTFPRRRASYRDYEETTKELPLVHVQLRFTPQLRFRVEDHWDADSLFFHRDGTIQASMHLPDSDWLDGFLLGFGDQVEVLSPPQIRNRLKLKANNIAKLYNPDIGLSLASAKLSSKLQRRKS